MTRSQRCVCVYAPTAVLVHIQLPFPYLLLVALPAMWYRPVPLPPHSSTPLFSVSAAPADKRCWKKTDAQKSGGKRGWTTAMKAPARKPSCGRNSAEAWVWEHTMCWAHQLPPQNNSARNLLANPRFQVPGGLSSFIPALGRLGRKIQNPKSAWVIQSQNNKKDKINLISNDSP